MSGFFALQLGSFSAWSHGLLQNTRLASRLCWPANAGAVQLYGQVQIGLDYLQRCNRGHHAHSPGKQVRQQGKHHVRPSPWPRHSIEPAKCEEAKSSGILSERMLSWGTFSIAHGLLLASQSFRHNCKTEKCVFATLPLFFPVAMATHQALISPSTI